MTSLREWLSRLRGAVTRRRSDSDLADELASHLELAEEELRAEGRSRREAARLARVRFGGATQAMADLRAQRGLPGIDTWWLDLKLGLRMLRKSWGLTLVGGLGMTVAISIGVFVFFVSELLLDSTLPLDEGDRVVALQTWDATSQRRAPTRLADFERWRESLQQVVEVSAFETVERNLVSNDGAAEPVEVAEITASGFRLARVAPRLGRALVEADESRDAPPVVLIGHGVWRSRFDSDPEVVGRTLRLGAATHTIVGVMPEGFAFPVNHSLWVPLRLGEPGSGRTLRAPPMGSVFARLAPGASLDTARAELLTVGLLPPSPTAEEVADPRREDPPRGETLHPRVVPYPFGFTGDFEADQVRWVLRIVLLLITLLLVPPCANVAILVYARTVMRQEELSTRFALGASRARVVGQLFLELLVLAAASAAVALLGVRSFFRFMEARQDATLPFWLDFGLTAETVAFTVGLAVLAAAIASLVPALQATRRLSGAALRGLSTRSALGLGAIWTALVVGQVAFSLAVLPAALEMAWGTLRTGILGPGFAAEEWLSARLAIDENARGDESADVRVGAVRDELARRLAGEPVVRGVAFAANVPGEEPWIRVEVEGRENSEVGLISGKELVQVNRVDDRFFELFRIRPLTGRLLDASDQRSDAVSVVVDRTFVEQLIGDGNPLGRRLRYRRGPQGDDDSQSRSHRWYEIVGVIDSLPANKTNGKVFHPAAAAFGGERTAITGEEASAAEPSSTIGAASTVLVRIGTEPVEPAERLREIGLAIDPNLRIDDVRTLEAIYREQAFGNNLGSTILGVVTLSVLLLSAAGIYALMSFTVNRRRREIGIRAALGAPPGRLLTAVFRRALRQLGIGAAIGILAAYLLRRSLPIVQFGGWEIPGVVPAAALLMVAIGLAAALGPSRRGLRIDPLKELREG